MIQLYSYFRSSASYRVRVALEFKGINYAYKPVHLVKDGGEQHRSEFKELNPMGQLPCLVDGDFVLSQSMAILLYLEDKFSTPSLFPQCPQEKAQVLQICEIVNSGIHPIQNLSVMQEIDKRFSVGGEGKVSWAAHWIKQGFNGLEKSLEKISGTHAFGAEITAADLFIVPQVYNARRFGVDLAEFPNIEKVEQNALKLEAFIKAEPGVQPDAPETPA